LLLVITAASRSFGATYYVAPTGLDLNPGSLAQPWGTIQKAANVLAPGDTVYVRAGIYAKVTVNVSGSAAGGYVTFSNYPGETPVIDATGVNPPDDDDTGLFLLESRSYVIITGFELRNYKTTSTVPTPAGIFLNGACQHVQILNCNIHDIWSTGGDTNNSGNAFGLAVYGSSTTPATDLVVDGNDVHDLKTGSSESMTFNGNVTNFQVTNNTVHDNNNIGIDFIGFEGTCPDPAQDQARDGVCADNTVWNISSQDNQAYPNLDYSADGLYCDGSTGVILEYNIVHDTDIPVELASEHAGKLTSAITVRDNFIYSNRQTGLFLGGYASSGTGGTEGCTITGNTFYNDDTLQEGNGEVQVRYRTSNCTLLDNIFYSGPGDLLVTVPVSAANNVNNQFDYNLYYSADGLSAAQWIWNNKTLTGLAAWQNASGQDSHSLFADPKFVLTGASPDLHLQAGSPAINTGDPAFVPATGETDIDGNPRVVDGRVDIGADEFQFSVGATGTSQTITFPAIGNQTYGGAPFSTGASASSGLAVTYTHTGPVTISGNTVTITGTGTVYIRAHQDGNATYAPAPTVLHSFTVAPAPQTITFSAIANQTVGATFTLSATASSGLPITYTHTSGVKISGATATATAAQTVTIGGSQAGNANFAAAPEVRQTFTVNPTGGGG